MLGRYYWYVGLGTHLRGWAKNNCQLFSVLCVGGDSSVVLLTM